MNVPSTTLGRTARLPPPLGRLLHRIAERHRARIHRLSVGVLGGKTLVHHRHEGFEVAQNDRHAIRFATEVLAHETLEDGLDLVTLRDDRGVARAQAIGEALSLGAESLEDDAGPQVMKLASVGVTVGAVPRARLREEDVAVSLRKGLSPSRQAGLSARDVNELEAVMLVRRYEMARRAHGIAAMGECRQGRRREWKTRTPKSFPARG